MFSTTTYVTGGITISDELAKYIGAVDGIYCGGYKGYNIHADVTNKKLVFYEDKTTAAATPLLEETATAVTDGTLYWCAIGRIA